jgi:hypothetical protein
LLLVKRLLALVATAVEETNQTVERSADQETQDDVHKVAVLVLNLHKRHDEEIRKRNNAQEPSVVLGKFLLLCFRLIFL